MKSEVVIKTVFDELVKKVNATQTIDTGHLVKKSSIWKNILKRKEILKRKLLIMINKWI